jgi:hypothetical protein
MKNEGQDCKCVEGGVLRGKERVNRRDDGGQIWSMYFVHIYEIEQ